MSTSARAALAAAAIVAAAILFFVLSGDGEDNGETATEATTTEASKGQATKTPKSPAEADVAVIEVENGEPVGGVEELSFEHGERIRFVVESDVAEEVHLHGYDVAIEVAAGGEAEFDVPATIEGVFEVELEHSLVPVAEISVNPG
jgi:hypothetical protein